MKEKNTSSNDDVVMADTAVQENLSSDNAIDFALIERVRAGNKDAFDLLVSKYQYRLACSLYSYLKDSDETMDVVQDTFVKAFLKLDTFKGDSSFYSWLYRIGVNTAKNYLKASKSRPPKQDVDIHDAAQYATGAMPVTESPEELLNQQQLSEQIYKSIGNLPEELKNILLMREKNGMSYQEIAEAVNIPVGTVRSRLFRAREILMDEIDALSNR